MASQSALFYTLKNRDYCREAKTRLELAGVEFKEIDVEERNLWAAIPRDLDVVDLPVIVSENRVFAGDEGVADFLRGVNGRAHHESAADRATKLWAFPNIHFALSNIAKWWPERMEKVRTSETPGMLGAMLFAFLCGVLAVAFISLVGTVISDSVFLLQPTLAVFLIVGFLGLMIELLVSNLIPKGRR